MRVGAKIGSFFRGLFFFLFWRISSFLLTLPAWVTLILHFTLGISIWWFWGLLIAWFVLGILRYILIRFGRWGASIEEETNQSPNKNPYSSKFRY